MHDMLLLCVLTAIVFGLGEVGEELLSDSEAHCGRVEPPVFVPIKLCVCVRVCVWCGVFGCVRVCVCVCVCRIYFTYSCQ